MDCWLLDACASQCHWGISHAHVTEFRPLWPQVIGRRVKPKYAVVASGRRRQFAPAGAPARRHRPGRSSLGLAGWLAGWRTLTPWLLAGCFSRGAAAGAARQLTGRKAASCNPRTLHIDRSASCLLACSVKSHPHNTTLHSSPPPLPPPKTSPCSAASVPPAPSR